MLLSLVIQTELRMDPSVLPVKEPPANYKTDEAKANHYAKERAKVAAMAARWPLCGDLTRVAIVAPAEDADTVDGLVRFEAAVPAAPAVAIAALRYIRNYAGGAFVAGLVDGSNDSKLCGEDIRETLRRLLVAAAGEIVQHKPADSEMLLETMSRLWPMVHHDDYRAFDPYLLAVPAAAQGSVACTAIASYMGVPEPADWDDPGEVAGFYWKLGAALGV